MPTLMMTAEQTPTLVHCGPFANIAQLRLLLCTRCLVASHCTASTAQNRRKTDVFS
jgi:formyltetrahydrofolate synthetase